MFNQTLEVRSAAELDAFADVLGRLVLENPSRKIADDALMVLQGYERGLDILIEVYEALDGTEAITKCDVLITIRYAGARGEDYVMNLFASIERPEKACWLKPYTYQVGPDGWRLGPPYPPEEEWCPYETQWCEVGDLLIRSKVEGVDPEHVYSICGKCKLIQHRFGEALDRR